MPDPLLIEIWKPVVGHEDAYEVSSFGRVRSLDRWVPRIRPGNSGTRMWCCGKILAPRFSTSGHAGVQLTAGVHAAIHRLVLEAFVGPCPPGQECLHGNGDEKNNCLSNLKWGTRRENQLDRKKHTPVKGGLCYNEIVHIKKLLFLNGMTVRAIAKKFGVSPSLVGAIRVGKRHADVTFDM